ncbi:MAG: hypothetical protein MZV70_55540 [Desulfobacterales bacterium]|nr:hypothetical protein [Desulfobacterales bacterium]
MTAAPAPPPAPVPAPPAAPVAAAPNSGSAEADRQGTVRAGPRPFLAPARELPGPAQRRSRRWRTSGGPVSRPTSSRPTSARKGCGGGRWPAPTRRSRRPWRPSGACVGPRRPGPDALRQPGRGISAPSRKRPAAAAELARKGLFPYTVQQGRIRAADGRRLPGPSRGREPAARAGSGSA